MDDLIGPQRAQPSSIARIRAQTAQVNREIQEQLADMHGNKCQACKGTGLNGGERCEWCDGWGE